MEADEIEASTMEIENAKCLSLVNFCMKTCIWQENYFGKLVIRYMYMNYVYF